MEIKITRIQKLILQDVFKAGGKIDSYTLYRRYTILPQQLAKALEPLVSKEYLASDGGVINLTEKGKKWITSKNIVYVNDKKVWLEIPSSFAQPKLDVFGIYVPVLEQLSKEILPEKYWFVKEKKNNNIGLLEEGT